ncbi:anti-sigma regulatory factor [Thermosynechococcaceae cyanobacterium BACA0444]|uniref:Anti-sigma regulatory factor n=1 Tax=Pseudocalidococcus azoricus BACA0444 TaxID=2918990 RepID=A0AAE4FVM5_9CYAN|nr:anti-sigma regulatory factor [Pseudocalidococcus azoricus]MDS3861891.1 anti-sigma regulatory factor [Pseudocalidococcus azoricus BACA0444]
METLVLPAELDSLEPIGKYVLNAAKVAGLSQKKAYRLRLAVDELATNIINYGYANQSSPVGLEISAELAPTFLKIILIDSGLAYDPRERNFDESILEEPIEERPIGGLGIFLALQNVDEFSYQVQSDQNISSFLVRIE